MAVKNNPAASGAGEAPKATSAAAEEITISDEDAARTAELSSTDKKFIHYVGEATNRIISKKDWKGIGIEAEGNEWNLANGFRIETSKFNDKQIHYLLKVDGRFKAVDK